MTKEEAISIIEERIRVTEYVKSSYVDCVDIEALRMAIKALKQPEPQWIPCSEGLPEPNEVVLISVNGAVDADWIAVDNTGYGCWYRTMKCAIDIDAWMPLPEPWKGEQP